MNSTVGSDQIDYVNFRPNRATEWDSTPKRCSRASSLDAPLLGEADGAVAYHSENFQSAASRGHLKFGAMAFKAVLREYRPDLRFEEFGGARSLGGGGAGQECREQSYEKGASDVSHKRTRV